MELIKKPYIYWLIGIFLVYLILNLFFTGFYKTIPLIIFYAKTVNWFKLIISLILSLAIGFFVAANSIYLYLRYKERRKCVKGVTTTGIGAIGGVITGVCPLCVSLLPIILGFVGISFSIASLPLEGIEIQILVLILLIFGYANLNN